MASSYEKIPAPETTYNGMVGKWSPSKSNPDNSSWIEKPKSTKNVDPGFGRTIPTPKPKVYAGDNSKVNKIYGPIAPSSKPTPKTKPKPKQDITKIPGFKFGRGTE